MNQYLVKLHLSILISCFTGILGRIITANEFLLVWNRFFITCIFFMAILLLTKKFCLVHIKEFWKITGLGALLAIHWILFYGSIKFANVSVGLVAYSTVGLFAAIFEPIILKRKFSPRELFFSFITIAGIALIFSFDFQHRFGLMLGIISAAFDAIFTILNKPVMKRHTPNTMLFYELLGGLIVTSAILPVYLKFANLHSIVPSGHDLFYLLILSLCCTVWLYKLQIQVLRKLSAFTVNLTYNLEPVYTIILAMIIFHEAKELNWAFFAGLSLIILSVVLQTICVIISNKRQPAEVEVVNNEY